MKKPICLFIIMSIALISLNSETLAFTPSNKTLKSQTNGLKECKQANENSQKSINIAGADVSWFDEYQNDAYGTNDDGFLILNELDTMYFMYGLLFHQNLKLNP